jgi:uncharacterized protein (DUF2141 family)
MTKSDPLKISITILLTAVILVALSCATPMGPTGGEPDRTGPVVIDTYPANGTTNFTGSEVRFTFDEFVDRNSFRRNVSIEPDLAIELEYSFRRRTAIVEFKSPLPENTTFVVKVGVDVTDTQRNKMTSSFDLALSTGDELDEGEVTGRLIDANTGRGESGKRVFLYRKPVDLSERANYVAQTDTAGLFKFGYLSEGTYRAFWVDDVNRNRRWDRERERAQPFKEQSFELGQNQVADVGNLFYTIPDTTSPRIEGVGLLSERRLRLRLSEPPVWKPGAYLAVTDTLGNEFTRAWPLYDSESDPNVFFAQSEQALPEEEMFTLIPSGFTDAAGNPLTVDVSPFSGSSEPDTTGLKTISHNAGSGLFPDEPLEIKYSKFIDDNVVVDSLLVFEGDQMFEEWPAVEVDRHILRIWPKNEVWESGLRYEFRVWNPWESERERINPDIWQRNQLGSIEIEVENADPEIIKYLRLTDRDNSILVDTTFYDSITVDNLPPLEYKAIVFEDVNGNGRWDPGKVDPFEKPEPYAIRRRIPVREGFTSEITLTFPEKTVVEDADDILLPDPETEIEEQIENSDND